MPVAKRWAYLDHAAVAPISGPARDAIMRWTAQAADDGDVHCGEWARDVEEFRRETASMVGAEPEEIALVPNTTAGLALVAEGFPWQPGDNVVTRADEFPTNQYPWMQLGDRGVETRRVPCPDGRLDIDRLLAACDQRTRIITISWVAFASGWRHDLTQLAEAAHARGILLCVDAIQALGVFPLDVRKTPIDFFAADGHKWLLGPEGAGVCFIRREHLETLRPFGVGWNSVVNELDFSTIDLRLKPSAARYEGGSVNSLGLLALGASMRLLAQYGQEALSRRILDLTDLACRRLEEIGAVLFSDRTGDRRSGIVIFEMPGRDHEELRRGCFRRDVVISCRGGRLRISPHAYNNAEDIERLIDALTR